jgi:hypothetical protein
LVDKSHGAIALQQDRKLRYRLLHGMWRCSPSRRKQGGRVDPIAQALHERVARCRRLAKMIYTPAVVAELEAYAVQLEERLARLEEAERLASSPAQRTAQSLRTSR